jgi:hypothetical protein
MYPDLYKNIIYNIAYVYKYTLPGVPEPTDKVTYLSSVFVMGTSRSINPVVCKAPIFKKFKSSN